MMSSSAGSALSAEDTLIAAAIARAELLAQSEHIDPLQEAPQEFHQLRQELVVSLLSTTTPVLALAKGMRREVLAADLAVVVKHSQSLATCLSVLAWKHKWMYAFLKRAAGISAWTALLGELYAIGDEIATNHGANAAAVPAAHAA